MLCTVQNIRQDDVTESNWWETWVVREGCSKDMNFELWTEWQKAPAKASRESAFPGRGAASAKALRGGQETKQPALLE